MAPIMIIHADDVGMMAIVIMVLVRPSATSFLFFIYCLDDCLDDKADDQDDGEENEASLKLEAAAPLAHLEGKHRTKTCSLHGISIFFKQPLLFCTFK